MVIASMATIIIAGLEISIDSLFTIGETAVINCTTKITVDNLLWLNQDKNITLANSSSSTMVTLEFNPVNDSVHDKIFTCRAEQTSGMVEKHVKVNVSGKASFNCLCSLINTCSLVCFVPTVPSGPFINVTISYPQNNPIMGNPYNLSCLYNVSKGFVTQEPIVLWTHPNQTKFTNSTIVFEALQASDSGKFTCEVMLISPVLEEPKVAKETYNLTIQRKPIIIVSSC